MRRDFDIRLAAGQVEKYPPLRTCLEYNCNEETGAMLGIFRMFRFSLSVSKLTLSLKLAPFQKHLSLKKEIRRVEAFDVSHSTPFFGSSPYSRNTVRPFFTSILFYSSPLQSKQRIRKGRKSMPVPA